MAEAPTPEELAAKRQELDDLRKQNAEAARARDDEAANARRQKEYEDLEREIEFEKQSQAILAGTPPSNDEEEVDNTPPNNSAVNEPPSSPSANPLVPNVNLGNDDDEKEGE